MHPCHFVTGELLAVVDLWLQCRGGDLVPERMPFAGGPAEQPAWLAGAFDVIRATAGALQARERGQAR